MKSDKPLACFCGFGIGRSTGSWKMRLGRRRLPSGIGKMPMETAMTCALGRRPLEGNRQQGRSNNTIVRYDKQRPAGAQIAQICMFNGRTRVQCSVLLSTAHVSNFPGSVGGILNES